MSGGLLGKPKGRRRRSDAGVPRRVRALDPFVEIPTAHIARLPSGCSLYYPQGRLTRKPRTVIEVSTGESTEGAAPEAQPAPARAP